MEPDADPGRLDDALAYIIYRVARLLRFDLLHFFKRFGVEITPEQWFILYRLWEQDGQSQIELSNRIFDDRPNITRIVDALERNSLVQRTQDMKPDTKFVGYQ